MPPKNAPSVNEVNNIKQKINTLQNSLDANQYKRKNTTIESLKKDIERLYPQNTPEKIIDHDIIDNYYILVNTFFEKIYADENERQNLYSSENGIKKKTTEYLYPKSFFLDIPLIYEKITFPITSLRANIERDLTETEFNKLLNSIIRYKIEINSYDPNIDMSVLIPNINILQENLTNIWKSKIDKINELSEQNADIRKQIELLSTKNIDLNAKDAEHEQLLQKQQTQQEELDKLKEGLRTIFNNVKEIAKKMGINITDEFTDDYTKLFDKILSLLEKINEEEKKNQILQIETEKLKEENNTLKTLTNNKQGIIDAQGKRNKELKIQFDNCEKEKEELTKRLEEISTQLKKNEEEITAREKQISPEHDQAYIDCLKEKEELQKRENEYKLNLKEKEEEIVQLGTELDQELEIKNQQHLQIQRAEDQIHQIENEVNEKDKEIILLKSKNNSDEQKKTENMIEINNLKTTNEKLQKDLLNCEITRDEYGMLWAGAVDYIDKISPLEAQIETLEEKKKELQAQPSPENTEKLASINKHIENLQREIEKKEEIIRNKEKEKCEKEKEEIRRRYEEDEKTLKNENEKLKESLLSERILKEQAEKANEKCIEEKKKLHDKEEEERIKYEKEKENLQKKIDENDTLHQNHEKTINELNIKINELQKTVNDQQEAIRQTHPSVLELNKTIDELERIKKEKEKCEEKKNEWDAELAKIKTSLKLCEERKKALENENTALKNELTRLPEKSTNLTSSGALSPMEYYERMKNIHFITSKPTSPSIFHYSIPPNPEDADIRRHIFFNKELSRISIYEPLFSGDNGTHYLIIRTQNAFAMDYKELDEKNVFSVCHLTPRPAFFPTNTIFSIVSKHIALNSTIVLFEKEKESMLFLDHAFPTVFGSPSMIFITRWLRRVRSTDFDTIGKNFVGGIEYAFSPNLAYAIDCGVLTNPPYDSYKPSDRIIRLHFDTRPLTLQRKKRSDTKEKREMRKKRRIQSSPILALTPSFLQRESYTDKEMQAIEDLSDYLHDWYINFIEWQKGDFTK